MNRLIKNELSKIFHKKAIYIILLVTLVFMVAQKVIYKFFENNDMFYYEEDISYYEEELKHLDKNNPDERDMYISFETNIEEANLIKKYGNDSWQAYIIRNKGYGIIFDEKNSEGTEYYDVAKTEYDKFIKRLESNDWKTYAKEELEEVNIAIKEMETSNEKNETQFQSLKDNKQALEWRLNKNISYANSNLNRHIEQWLEGRMQINDYNENTKTNKTSYSEKYENEQLVAANALLKYAIENEIDEPLNNVNGTNVLGKEANTELISVWSEYSIFVIIVAVVIAGTIMSEEFNKGTIKLLLVRPYKRVKILIAKFITCCIILLIALLAIAVMQWLVTGIVDGFGSFSKEVTIYNFSTQSVEQISVIKYAILTLIAKSPMFILLMTLAFILSTVFTNSGLAIALPLLGSMASEIINQLAYNFEKAKFLKFFVTPNWDLSIFLFGKMPQFEPISLPFSIVVCLVYFAVMLAISLVVFKKKDIKNI